MGTVKAARNPANLRSEKKIYVLLSIDATDVREVRHWLDDFCARYPFEIMFVADIKGGPPLEQPIGLAALLKFAASTLKPGLAEIDKELRKRSHWKYELMRAEWIEIGAFERAKDEVRRKVQTEGRISFRDHRYYVSQRLRGETVDLKIDGRNLHIYYNGTLVRTHKLL